MATLNIREDTYRKLEAEAVAARTTVNALVEPWLDRLLRERGQSRPQSSRLDAFQQWMSAIHSRARSMPAGHVVDDSREAISDERA